MSFQYEPLNEGTEFEELITDLFNKIHNTTSFQRYKPSGREPQFGIDVFSTEENICTVIQCKKRSLYDTNQDNKLANELYNTLLDCLEEAKNLPFSFKRFILAATTKKYGKVQDLAAKLSEETEYQVEYWSWDDIQAQIHKFPKLRSAYYPHLLENEEEEIKEEKLPKEIEYHFELVTENIDEGKYSKAEKAIEKIRELSVSLECQLGIILADFCSGVVIDKRDHNHKEGILIYQKCLEEFQKLDSKKWIARTLKVLGSTELERDNFQEAETYIARAIEFAEAYKFKQVHAESLHQLGWVRFRNGDNNTALAFYAQSLDYYLSEYQKNEQKDDRDIIWGLAACYHHIGLAHKVLHNYVEVETNFKKAIFWYEKIGFIPDQAKMKFLYAQFKYDVGQFEDGNKLMNAAKELYNKTDDLHGVYQCMDLQARELYTKGEKEAAFIAFNETFEFINQHSLEQELGRYLLKIGTLNLQNGDENESKAYFLQADEYYKKLNDREGQAQTLWDLAKWEERFGSKENGEKSILRGIQILENELVEIEWIPKKAYLLLQIGYSYLELKNHHEAMYNFEKAKKIYEELEDISMVAKTIALIINVHISNGNKIEEVRLLKELKSLVNGTNIYDLISNVGFKLGIFEWNAGNYHIAKTFLDEALYLAKKHYLPFKDKIESECRALENYLETLNPPEFGYDELVDDLYDLINFYPEAKDSLIRFWISGRWPELFANIRLKAGLKFFVVVSDLERFIELSEQLLPYSDLTLLVISDDYSDGGIDVVPFPVEKEVYGHYMVSSSLTESDTTKRKARLLTGWTPGFPTQIHALINSHNFSELKAKKIFFLPLNRTLFENKLLLDLKQCQDLNTIPVYWDKIDLSKDIEMVTVAEEQLPIINESDFNIARKEIRLVKECLMDLIAIPDKSAVTKKLNNLHNALEDLNDITRSSKVLNFHVVVLNRKFNLEDKIYVALVIKKVN